MRAERVAKEREALLTGISQRGLGLVERQPKLGHHPLRPRQRLTRTTAAEDDEVVSVGDNVSTEGFATTTLTPVLQEPVHVDVGQQWARHATLGRAALVPFAANHPPLPVAIPLLDRCLQPQLDQPQHGTVRNTTSHRLE